MGASDFCSEAKEVVQVEVNDYYVMNIVEYGECDNMGVGWYQWHYELRKWVYGSYTVLAKWTSSERLTFVGGEE